MVLRRGVGILQNPQGQIHFLDHLAVVCILMDIPLIFIDEVEYALGTKYYPGLDARQIPYEDFTPEYLVANFDVFFMSDQWDRRYFHQKYGPLEEKYQKRLRHVYCPHGYSDKAFHFLGSANEDIVLAYGQNMLDLLKSFGVLENLPYYVIGGNYRYTYFKQHQEFFDRIIHEEVFSRFARSQPTILYAPTWVDKDDTSTFFDAYSYILDNLPSDYNIIVKLHPRLELNDAGLYYRILGKYEDRGNILFLKDFPLVYPILARSDIYIGDMSAVGYDFLTFNKPMFFLNKKKRDVQSNRLFLYLCGVEIMPEQYSDIYSIIAATLPGDKERFSTIRSEVYQYTFGTERPFASIKEDIINAYNSVYVY